MCFHAKQKTRKIVMKKLVVKEQGNKALVWRNKPK